MMNKIINTLTIVYGKNNEFPYDAQEILDLILKTTKFYSKGEEVNVTELEKELTDHQMALLKCFYRAKLKDNNHEKMSKEAKDLKDEIRIPLKVNSQQGQQTIEIIATIDGLMTPEDLMPLIHYIKMPSVVIRLEDLYSLVKDNEEIDSNYLKECIDNNRRDKQLRSRILEIIASEIVVANQKDINLCHKRAMAFIEDFQVRYSKTDSEDYNEAKHR